MDPLGMHSPLGREAESAALERFLAGGAVARALVLVGDAGIGKTTLWEAGLERARDQGFPVLTARVSEAEARLSFAGLADLCDGVDAEALTSLPAPQLRALEVALRRVEPAGAPPDPLAISAGFLSAVRLLADRATVLIAIDDVPAMDAASADALAFAARRLGGDRVRFMFSRRTGRLSELERVFEPKGVERLELGALSFGAIGRVLTERLGEALPRRVLRRVFETSHGNPLFAIELGRAVLERGLPAYGAALPVPELLEDLFGARVSGLSAPMRRVLLAVALSAGLSQDELGAAVEPFAVEDALAAGLLVVERSRVRPSHPLLAAAAARRSSARERRDLHLTLASAVADQTLRARHLALAAAAPDEELAADVAAAAAVAAKRQPIQDAIELAAHALRLTPRGGVEYAERLLALAGYLSTSGDNAAVTELLAERIGLLPPGGKRAAALLLLALAEPSNIDDHLERAFVESAEDPGLRSRVLAARSIFWAVGGVERIREAEAVAQDALPAAHEAGVDEERRVLVALAWTRILRGRPIDDLSRRLPAAPVGTSLFEGSLERPVGVQLAFRGQLEAARAAFRRLVELADERGEAVSGTAFLVQGCELELRAGDARAAQRLLDEWDQWTLSDGEASAKRVRLGAVLAAVRGAPEHAIQPDSAVLVATGANSALAWDRLETARAAGIAALFDHSAERAVVSLRAVWEHTVREQVDDPGAFPVAADLVEALVESGDLGAAGEVTGRLRRLAREQHHPWGLATAERCASVIQLADRYDDAAAATLAGAAARYRELGLGFDCARSLLVLGRTQRRYKKRTGARESLEQAAAVFGQLGCDGWAEQARAELARVSGRRSARQGELTPSERRACELAAGGLSNKEIASHLFVGVSTVETHLSNAYAKLGVRSRTQLAGRLAGSS
jgi:DNA-binding CsgD family transcriptional regulator